MSGGNACRCKERDEPLERADANRPARLWRVLDRFCNYSAFNGSRRTPSPWSSVLCLRCGRTWRTKASYVIWLDDASHDERMNWPRSGECLPPDVATHADKMIELGRDPYNHAYPVGTHKDYILMRPFFPYYGSKWNIARHYPAPSRGIVVEPFAGAAGYSTFYDVPGVHLIDADPIIVGVWNYLIATTPREILALPDMPEVGDSVDNYTLPPEAKWLIGFWLNRGSATPKKSRTAYSARTDRSQLNWGPRAKERIASQINKIAAWTVQLGSFESADDYVATWFIDPPYGDKGKFYRVKFDRFSELGVWSLGRLGKVIVCEGAGATWLPFKPLGSFKSSLGRASEVVFTRDGGNGR